jgi:hypothetical protein
MDTRINMGTAAALIIFGAVLFYFSIRGNPSGLLIALAVLVAAVTVWMLGLMWRNNPPTEHP